MADQKKDTSRPPNHDARSEYFANMSHEIRTPLNGVVALTNLLLERDLGEEERSMVETIKSCSRSLLTIVNDILDFSKLESGKMTLENQPFSIVAAVNDVVKLTEQKANEKKLKMESNIESAVPKWVRGDVTRYSQVLMNLVGNAIKFTDKGSVKVRVKAEKTEAQNIFNVTTEVVDTGVGISEENIKKLFKNYSQAEESTTRRYGGTGLGLAISKNICELMGGTISVSCIQGEMTKFSFTLSMQSVDETRIDENVVETFLVDKSFATKYPFKILVAEDNEINRMVADSYLKKFGYTCDFANDGALAVDAIKNKQYDLIFMDVQMPNMDGMEATREIRKMEYPAKIIAMTANAFSGDKERCLEAGMDEYVTKPISLDALVKVLIKIGEGGVTSLGRPETRKETSGLINKTALMQHFGEDVDLIGDIVERFERLKDEMVDSIRNAIKSKQPKLLERSAHKLKGVVGNFFADELVNHLQGIEDIASKGNLVDPSEVERIEENMKWLSEELRSLKSHKAA